MASITERRISDGYFKEKENPRVAHVLSLLYINQIRLIPDDVRAAVLYFTDPASRGDLDSLMTSWSSFVNNGTARDLSEFLREPLSIAMALHWGTTNPSELGTRHELLEKAYQEAKNENPKLK